MRHICFQINVLEEQESMIYIVCPIKKPRKNLFFSIAFLECMRIIWLKRNIWSCITCQVLIFNFFYQVKMFLVVTLAYIIFWGPLFIVSSFLIQTHRLLKWFWQKNRWKHHRKQITIEVNQNELKKRRNKSKWKGNPCALGLDFWGRKAINGSWGDYGDSDATAVVPQMTNDNV